MEGNDEYGHPEEEASLPFLSKLEPPKYRWRVHISQCWPWMLSTVILASTSVTLLANSFYPPFYEFGSYETGFRTDLDAAFPVLEIEQRTFTGGLHWNENGTLVRNHLPQGQEWVGPPSPELDALWERVVDAGGIDLSGKDADMVRATTRQRPTGEYITGLDVFHQLHCLNRLRQSLYPQYYHDPDGKVIETLHNGEQPSHSQ
ncbi:hypothetical protein AtubIFM56815_004394 [Aspergillus tubingensis]|uniref:Uncharacterized protein n=1 Tax=Aspergillus tubingensis TaxID=5068 RepID=A0A9W6AZ96_ASPTU|nr:hypothetical protein AtubIFM56815_004394 [Aspergillus tubingensis]